MPGQGHAHEHGDGLDGGLHPQLYTAEGDDTLARPLAPAEKVASKAQLRLRALVGMIGNVLE